MKKCVGRAGKKAGNTMGCPDGDPIEESIRSEARGPLGCGNRINEKAKPGTEITCHEITWTKGVSCEEDIITVGHAGVERTFYA